jgi:hypothetical protein
MARRFPLIFEHVLDSLACMPHRVIQVYLCRTKSFRCIYAAPGRLTG